MKSIAKLIFVVILLSSQGAISQQIVNRGALLDYAKFLEQKAGAERAEAERVAGLKGLPVRIDQPNGVSAELQSVQGGRLFYYITNNVVAAQTISTSKVRPSGGYFNLTGSGQTLGEWDAGRVRREHQEFPGSRITQVDGASSNHSHATHVACTMVGAGTQANALGMSNGASLNAYDWNNDYYEMATAAANGLKVSNHSYSIITGWYYGNMGAGSAWYWMGDATLSATEDASYGRYDDYSQGVDSVAVLSPNYLICWAAANDRNAGPAAGTGHYFWNASGQWEYSTATRDKVGGTSGYDCIAHSALGKNIMTCAAVNGITGGWTKASDVVMSSFSGWGPADDGRIKPDISADGVSVYSAVADNDQSYAYYSGTSMATPNVSGSIGLLLQHQANLSKPAMRSSTMKALIIHTADEAGANAGPDYSFGWGLMNTLKAAQLMSLNASRNADFDIQELSLAQNATLSQEIYCDGTQPLKATIAWIDPPGKIAQYALDPSAAELVNDLDLRVIRKSDNTTYYPWKLDKDNPSAAATTGDNTVDNVEQTLLQTPSAGVYIVKITHKGSLRDGLSQKVSLILSGATNSYIITQNAPSQICAGGSFNLSYEIGGTFASGNQFIAQLSDASGSFASPVQVGFVTSTTATSVPVTIPSSTVAGSGYKVRIVSTNPAISGIASPATFTVNARPTPTISGATTACQYDLISLNGNTLPGASYSWSATNAAIVGSTTGSGIYLRTNNPGAVSVKLVLTNASGCVDSTTSNIAVYAQPTVSLTGETDVCGNRNYNYSANGAGTYSWTVAGGTIVGASDGSTLNVKWGGSGQGQVTVILTNANGCKDTAVAAVNIHTMSVPEVTGALETCEKKEEKYSANLEAGVTAKWTVEGGVINGPDNGSSVYVKWGSTGFAMVQLTYANPYGCVDSIRKGIIINDLPVPTISGEEKLCLNSIKEYTASKNDEGKNKWAAFGGTIMGSDSSRTVTIQWNQSGNNLVRLIQTNRNGCAVTVVKSVETLEPAKTTIVGPAVACAGKEFVYSADLKNISSAEWSVEGGTITNVSEDNKTLSVTWGDAGTGKVRLALVNTAGCSGVVERTINLEGAANVNVTGNRNVCLGGEEEYSVIKSSGYVYSWTAVGGTIIGVSNTNKVRIHWTEPTGELSLTVKTNGGCESVSTTTISADVDRIFEITGPTTTCSGSPADYKLDASATVKWKATGGAIVGADDAENVKVVWTSNNGVLEANYTVNGTCYHTTTLNVGLEAPVEVTITSPDHYCANTGNYTLTGEPAGGRFIGTGVFDGKFDTDARQPGVYDITYIYKSTAGCEYSSTKSINVFDQPEKPTIVVQDKLLVCEQDAAGYQWSLSDKEIAGAVNKTYEPTESGYYFVRTTNANGCVSDTSDRVHFNYVGVSDGKSESDLRAYPTPASDEIYVEIGERYTNSDVVLVDNLGREVGRFNAKGLRRLKIDVSGFASGVYYLQINSTGGAISQTIVISD